MVRAHKGILSSTKKNEVILWENEQSSSTVAGGGSSKGDTNLQKTLSILQVSQSPELLLFWRRENESGLALEEFYEAVN